MHQEATEAQMARGGRHKSPGDRLERSRSDPRAAMAPAASTTAAVRLATHNEWAQKLPADPHGRGTYTYCPPKALPALQIGLALLTRFARVTVKKWTESQSYLEPGQSLERATSACTIAVRVRGQLLDRLIVGGEARSG